MAYDYSKYSYDELIAEVTRLVRQQGEWTDAYQSSTGQILIQTISAITDQLHYMLERRTRENFLPTADLDTSVRAIVNLLGYRPTRKRSATGSLALSIIDESGTNEGSITIPKYSAITFDGKNFVTTEEIILHPTTEYPYTFSVIEGTLAQQTFDATDITGTLFNKNYIEMAKYADIENSILDISTPTQTYIDVEERVGDAPAIGAIGFAAPTDTVFDVRATNVGIQIVFGDGINGAKPVGTVTVKWIESSGSGIEILSIGNEFVFTDYQQLTDSLSNTYAYSLTNSTTVTGGRDEETVEDIKLNAPKHINTSNRAITKEDFKYWIAQAGIGDIVGTDVYGEEEIGITTINANNVYVTYLTSDGAALTKAEKDALQAFMSAYKQITTHIVLQKAETVPIQINLKLKRNSLLTASNSEVFAYIKSELNELLSFSSTSLNDDLYHSELVDHFHGLTITKNGVDYVIADYVHIEIAPLKIIDIPEPTSIDTDITITYGIDGDVYSLIVNNVEYSYTSQVGDDASVVAEILANYISFDPSVTATATTNVITLSLRTQGMENLLRWSEDYTNALWTNDNVIVTANNAVAPNGETTADLLNVTSTTVNGSISRSRTVLPDSTEYLQRIFVEKDAVTTRFPALEIAFTGGTGVNTVVHLNTQTGATTVADGAASPTINVVSYRNYWDFQIGLSNNSTNTSVTYKFYPAHDSVWGNTGDVTTIGSVNAFGSQLVNDSTFGAYTKVEGESFTLDLDDFPLENRYAYSDALDNAAWTKTNATITTGETDPLTTTTAFKLVEATDTTQDHWISQNIGTDITRKTAKHIFYAAPVEQSYVHARIYNVTTASSVYAATINLTTGVVTEEVGGSASKAITVTASAGGYYKIIMSDVIADDGVIRGDIFVANATTYAPYNGDGASGILLWRPQSQFIKQASSIYVRTLNREIYLYEKSYSLTNENSTTPANAAIDIEIQLHDPLLENIGAEQIIVPGSVELINEAGTVLTTDDGIGTFNGGTINYTSGLIVMPLIANGKYYIRYDQSIEQNVLCNSKQSLYYLDCKATYSDATETLSTIEIL